MKIKNIQIYFIKKKKFKCNFPCPSFFKDGFIFFKLICENNIEGYGEPSPYIHHPKMMVKKIEKLFYKYFQNQTLDLNFVEKIKKNEIDNNLKKILPAFEQAIFDIKAKCKKTNVSSLIKKKTQNI